MPGIVDPLDDSILIVIRPVCNVDKNDNGFDEKLIPIANAYIMEAHEFGVGYDGFRITGSKETWRDGLGNNGSKLGGIQEWLGLSVLLDFDPPSNSSELSSIQARVNKLAWLLRGKSQREGFIKEYVPEHADFYEDE